MINKLLIPFFLLLFFADCKHSELNCNNFKKGSFIQNIEEDKAMVYSLRDNKGFQRDSSKFGINRYKLTWKSNCKYEAELVYTDDEFSQQKIGRKYSVEIIKILNEKEYIYKCRVDGIDFEDQDTIIKVN